ncbi:MAG: DUF4142 domain-containing protein [Aeromicrobium sp.]|uniref:DUF4142 domain-containing protein n=1 Tax=Aeromicrobium sp. TaxID=1871063 RepID=UPI00262111A3|nr:DUF4142 domain-containing protein [Aeromicrobium sp.]MDF1706086.1 DUF4142 domain-containing protein [Aeromicrobium sp.]
MGPMTRIAAVALLLTTLVGCGADANDADETYVGLRGGGLGGLRSIAELALERSDDEAVTGVAADMVDQISDVLDDLRDLEDDWDLPPIVASAGSSLPSSVRDPDVERLEELEGAEFDELWVQLALESLASAQSSAETVVAAGSSSAVREIAEGVLADVTRWTKAVEDLDV